MIRFKGFIQIILLLGVLGWVIFSYPGFYPIPQLTTKVVSVALSYTGIETLSHNEYLIANLGGHNQIFHLSIECAGLILYAVFIFTMLLVPGYSLRARILAFALLPLLFLVNCLRLYLSVVIAKYISLNASIFFHDVPSQLLIFFSAILGLVLLLKLSGEW